MNRQTVSFDFGKIETAFEYANFGGGVNEAFLDRQSSQLLYFSSLGDSDPEPEDFDDESRYIQLPDKRDLGLGAELVQQFVSTTAPELSDAVRDAFRRRGAFRRFKALLESNGMLEAWYQFEADAEKAALVNWCHENDIQLST
ncbi:MAG: hypothetical protein KDB00_19900 [Planctomycetales bacterium]|nr:hypothetical protein [Planctomycetales bacterium]